MQKDVLAVLAAVTEIIQEGGGEESETEYFAALLTALLSLVIRKVPAEILRSRFGSASKTLYSKLMEVATKKEAGGALRYLISCLCCLLTAQGEGVWQERSTETLVHSLLHLTSHEHPRVRKAVRNGICRLLETKEEAEEERVHPSARLCAEFSVQQLTKYDGTKSKADSITLHVLNLLEGCMHRMNRQSFKTLAETILQVLSSAPNDSAVASAAFRTLYWVFIHQPPSWALSAETNGQLIHAILDFKPPTQFALQCADWLRVLCEAHVSLGLKDPTLNASHLQKTFDTALDMLDKTTNPTLCNAISRVLIRLASFCLSELADAVKTSEKRTEIVEFRVLDGVLRELDVGLKSPTTSNVAVEVVGAFFQATEETAMLLPSFNSAMRSLARLREDSEEEANWRSVERAVLEAMRHCGLPCILEALPLGLSADSISFSSDFPRSWLLVAIRRGLRRAELGFFAEFFLPLAMKLRKQLEEWRKEGETGMVLVYEVMERQIWELLAPFARSATDIPTALPRLAQVMGLALMECPNLRRPVLNALRELVLRRGGDQSDSDTRQTVAKYAKNYLPILFNIYTADRPPEAPSGYDDAAVRSSALAAIRLYLGLSSEAELEKYLETAMMKMVASDNDTSGSFEERRRRITDIVVALVRHLNQDQIRVLFEKVWPWFQPLEKKQQHLQKKAYRILEEVCISESSEAEAFLTTNLDRLKDLLEEGNGQCSASAQAARLVCLRKLLEKLQEPGKETSSSLEMVFRELVSCLCRNYSLKTRKISARNLVKLVGDCVSASKTPQKTLEEVFAKLEEEFSVASESKEQAACGMTARRLLVHEFRNDLTPETISGLVALLPPALKSTENVVVEQGLLLLKKLTTALSAVTVRQYETLMLQAFFSQNQQNRKSLRRLNEIMLRLLMNGLGASVVEKVAPEAWRAQVVNVRKAMGRKMRKKEQMGKEKAPPSEAQSVVSRPDTIAQLLRDSDTEVDDQDLDTDRKSSKSRFSAKTPVWLKEDEEEEIVDLLQKDRLARKIATVNPKAEKSKSRDLNRGFKTTADGRLIIQEDKIGEEVESEEEDEEELLNSRKRKGEAGLKGREKRKRMEEKEKDVDDAKSSVSRRSVGKGSRARGGKKKKDPNLEPYEYVPLNFKALNPRKRAQFRGQFKGLVGGRRQQQQKF